MKLGKVLINLSYVVDLDNEEMVKQAKQFLCEDMSNLVKYEDIHSWVATVEDSSLSEKDIPSFLLEEEE